jgi:hypothetical protein
MGYAIAYMVEELCYKPSPKEARDIFQFAQYFQSHHGPGIYSASNRNVYQKIFLWSKAGPTGKVENVSATVCEPIIRLILLILIMEVIPAPKHRFLQNPHHVTPQKTKFFVVTTVKP